MKLIQLNCFVLQHGRDSEKPLRYSHLDIAASAGDFPEIGTGAPVLALAKRFLLSDLENSLVKDFDNNV